MVTMGHTAFIAATKASILAERVHDESWAAWQKEPTIRGNPWVGCTRGHDSSLSDVGIMTPQES